MVNAVHLPSGWDDSPVKLESDIKKLRTHERLLNAQIEELTAERRLVIRAMRRKIRKLKAEHSQRDAR